VKKVMTWKRCVYLDFVESNLFMKYFDYFQPINSPLHLHIETCMHFVELLHYIMVNIWGKFPPSYPMHNKHLCTHVPWIPQKNIQNNHFHTMPKMSFYDWSFSIILLTYAILSHLSTCNCIGLAIN
jgi:hypothetical protein